MNTIIKVQDLVKVFDNQEVIKHCNINVEKGSIYGFLGANGAGKTTVLKLIAGLLKPTTGNIIISDMNISENRNNILRKIGCIIETPIFYEHLSAEENLKIHNAYMNFSGADINAVLQKVGLGNTGNIQVYKFSLGMKQRLGIARAIIHNPDILLLDEPINGLDPMGIKQMRDLFISLAKEYDMTLIISSHILSEIEYIADTIGIISNGSILKEIPMSTVKQEFPNGLEEYFFEIMNGGNNCV